MIILFFLPPTGFSLEKMMNESNELWRLRHENHRLRKEITIRDNKITELEYEVNILTPKFSKYYTSLKLISSKIPSNFMKAKYAANRRNKEWTLTEHEYHDLLLDNKCYYCQGPLSEGGIKLDRLDNTKGYNIENVVPCCYRCNVIRGDRFTPKQMKRIAEVLNGYLNE